MTRLGKKLASGIPASAIGAADPVPDPARPTRLAAAIMQAPRGEDVILPIFGEVYLLLVGHAESNKIEGATFRQMPEDGLPPVTGHAWSYDINRKARTLAVAVRVRENHDEPFGTEAEWLKLDDSVIYACALVYDDVKNRLDPVGAGLELTDEDNAAIRDAFEKKNASLLQSFGVAMLARWLLTSGVQLETSPIPESSTGPASGDISDQL